MRHALHLPSLKRTAAAMVRLGSLGCAAPAVHNFYAVSDATAITFFSTDLETWRSERYASPGGAGIECAVGSIALFRDVLKGLKGKTAEIEVDYDGTLTVAGARIRPVGDYKAMPYPPANGEQDLAWSAFADEARPALSRILPAISKEDSRFQLQAGWLDRSRMLCATDGHRMHVAPAPGEVWIPEAAKQAGTPDVPDGRLIPRHVIAELIAIKAKGGAVELRIRDDREVTRHPETGVTITPFAAGRDTVRYEYLAPATGYPDFAEWSYSPMEGTFPNWRRVLRTPEADDFTMRVETAALKDVCGRLLPFTHDRRAIRCEMNGKVVLSAANPDRGSLALDLPTLELCDPDSDNYPADRAIGLNPVYMADLAKVGPEATLFVKDENSQVRADFGDGVTAIVMPIRI